MAKSASKSQKPKQPAPAEPVVESPVAETEASFATEQLSEPRRRRWLPAILAITVLVVLLVVGFNLAYAGKVYPGVSADGVYLGGLGPAEAKSAIRARLDDYQREPIVIRYNNGTTVAIAASKLDAKYDVDQAVAIAMNYGRQGSLTNQLTRQARALFARATLVSAYSYSDTKLTPFLRQIDEDVTKSVSNAGFDFGSAEAEISPSTDGRRLDRGRLAQLVGDRLAATSSDPIEAPVYTLPALIGTDDLMHVKDQADRYLDGPISLKFSGGQAAPTTLNPSDIVGWITVSRQMMHDFGATYSLTDIYPSPTEVKVGINDTKLTAYVAYLASKIDQKGQNAALTITDGRATIFSPSRDGFALDQVAAVASIKSALDKSADGRALTLDVKVSKPDVREENLNDLGIKELISEGVTTFPGSSAARITNIKLGAAQDNGILVKPGDTFSFNEHFVDVDAAHGWQPGLSIVGDKIYPIYGGGICQVSSTAFRAALLAGLPIVERTTHAYAVSFYTAPFGVPGVDATVYNPGVDFKFKNDTPGYILIQTIIQGNTLKFDFYGTKTKTGAIRGPNFIDGSTDFTKPSTTVFYRDIMDLSGKLLKTDTFTQHYKSSLDFTHVDTP